jgi:hypothetical protein
MAPRHPAKIPNKRCGISLGVGVSTEGGTRTLTLLPELDFESTHGALESDGKRSVNPMWVTKYIKSHVTVRAYPNCLYVSNPATDLPLIAKPLVRRRPTHSTGAIEPISDQRPVRRQSPARLAAASMSGSDRPSGYTSSDSRHRRARSRRARSRRARSRRARYGSSSYRNGRRIRADRFRFERFLRRVWFEDALKYSHVGSSTCVMLRMLPLVMAAIALSTRLTIAAAIALVVRESLRTAASDRTKNILCAFMPRARQYNRSFHLTLRTLVVQEIRKGISAKVPLRGPP